jgi:hypothetical protein
MSIESFVERLDFYHTKLSEISSFAEIHAKDITFVFPVQVFKIAAIDA